LVQGQVDQLCVHDPDIPDIQESCHLGFIAPSAARTVSSVALEKAASAERTFLKSGGFVTPFAWRTHNTYNLIEMQNITTNKERTGTW
jgi:hypothetical protein